MPDWRVAVRARLRSLNLEGGREFEIVEEIAQHLEDRFAALIAGGLAEQRALAVALDELETSGAMEERLRAAGQKPAKEPLAIGKSGGRGWFGGVWCDLRLALRLMRSKPAFSAAAIGMLALAVAGNSAIFSIFNGMFLRPLPFPEGRRLMDLDETAPQWNLQYVGISNQDFYGWQKSNATFSAMAAYDGGGANLSDASGTARRVRIARVTRDMLDVLGLKPALGRDFSPEEDRKGADKVALLGYDIWQRQFQGDRGVVGRAIKLDDQPYRVIGVLPKLAVLPPDADLWTPLAADLNESGSFYLQAVGRLKPGVTIEQARADLLRVHRSMPNIAVANAHQVTSPVVQPVQDRFLGDFKPVGRILIGAVALVLLIACVNIAGLMLVHGEARSREIAIRAAVGASRARMVRQLLTESLLLAGIGGGVGMLGGNLVQRVLIRALPQDLPGWIRFDMDFRFALFCAAVTGAAALLFGLAPALQAAAVGASGCIQESGRSSLSRGKRGVLSALVVSEVTLALALLVGSGLLLQAFRKVLRADAGFRPEGVLTWQIQLPEPKYKRPEGASAFYRDLQERLKNLPGVTAVSAASHIPLGGHTGNFFVAEGARPLGPGEKNPVVLTVTAMQDYFRTMGIPILAGRDFDGRDAEGPSVAVVNETFARRFWPGVAYAGVIGKRIRYTYKKTWSTVVGVTRDTRHYGLDSEVRPGVFFPFSERPQSGMTIALRSSLDPAAMAAPARQVVRSLDPELPMFEVSAMSERVDRSLWVRRLYSSLFAAFALVAILLAAAGLYGVVSFAVSRRAREIGIRMALGAQPRRVLANVLRDGMALVAAGVGIGLVVSYSAAGVLQSMLFDVSARDAATYAGVAALVVAVGLLANYFPARRAASLDPMTTLRSE